MNHSATSRLAIVLLPILCLPLLKVAQASTDAATPMAKMDPALFSVSEVEGPDKVKRPAGTIAAAEGKEGPGLKISIAANSSGGFITTRLRPTPDWNDTAGFSFWVKGDGSENWGGIEMIDHENFGARYGYCFPIDSTDWQKITVRWNDLTPEVGAPLRRDQGRLLTGRLRLSLVRQVVLLARLSRPNLSRSQTLCSSPSSLLRPAPAEASDPGLRRLKAKLAAHQPITIVTMGDSLSDKHHWSNHDTLWSELLAKSIHEKFGSDVKLINPAIGGTTLSQNMVLMPRWLKQAPKPDLVAVWFGGNDWDSGVRGPRFKEYLETAVDRIRQQTNGASDILLMTTAPSFDKWQNMAELEEAVRDVARQKQTALDDIAAEFHAAGSNAEAMKRDYWAWDRTHLGAKGHQMVSDSVLRLLRQPPDPPAVVH